MAITGLLNRSKQWASQWLIRYLTGPVHRYQPFSVSDVATLRAVMQPADVLLVEGNQRFSTAVKYLTQSTWSHAALYIGEHAPGQDAGGHPLELVEADLESGVAAVPLAKYQCFNTRICRPVGLTTADRHEVVQFMIASLGLQYDLKNVVDLARYLLATPPVPVHWRRRMLAFGSGDPTRVICSTRIAQAFQSVRYPILPDIEKLTDHHPEDSDYTVRELLHIRHYSLFTPRDFDLSPYFAVVKPTIERGFDYRTLNWADDGARQDDGFRVADRSSRD